MPGGDGTGPGGMGPMTGRAAGYCAGYAVPGFMNPGQGWGYWGAGRGGGGRGRRNWYYATGLTGWQRASLGMPALGGPPAYPLPYAAQLCERAVIVDAGVVVADGPIGELLADTALLAAHRLELPWGFAVPRPS